MKMLRLTRNDRWRVASVVFLGVFELFLILLGGITLIRWLLHD